MFSLEFLCCKLLPHVNICTSYQIISKHYSSFNCSLSWKPGVHQCTLMVKGYRHGEQSTFLRTSVQLCPPFPQLQWLDKHRKCASLLRFNPTTTTTNLIKLESCKPYHRLAVLLTLFQPFQIFVNYSSSGKVIQLRMSNKHATEEDELQSECVNVWKGRINS